MLIKPLIFIGLFSVHSLVQADHTKIEERYSGQREVYKELTALLRSGELEQAVSRRNELNGYPLTDYFDYLTLRQRIDQANKPAELLAQVATLSADERLHRRLLGAVKNRSVKLARWGDYNRAFLTDNAPYHPCDDMLGGYKNGRAKQFDKQAADLWPDVDRHTGNCRKAFSMLLAEVSDVPTAALWQRTVELITRGNLDTARSLLSYYNRRDADIVKVWIDGYKNPARALQNVSAQGKTAHHKKIAKFFLSRWARNDMPAAMAFWRANGGRFGFSAKEVGEVGADYAVLSAKRGLPTATRLLDGAIDDQDARFWRVRVALRNKNWGHCLATLDQLTGAEQAMPRWQYWRARCLEFQGFRSAAAAIYKGIAGEFEYYGFLAADRLLSDYSIRTAGKPDADFHELKNDPQIIKALEFFFVDLPWEGRREWRRAIKESSPEQLLAAAHLAESVGWYDQSLRAASRAGASDSLQWLYPEPHKAEVTQVAARYGVPNELVYGVMRRESRFISDIKSPAGAVGLMQLMPGTAKQMGDELGVNAQAWRLIQSDLNIKLGVRYLDFVLDRFDNNFAFAAAAYNAGPSRVKKWIADRPYETDLWVETIPFDETRTYVQAVLFNTVVFEWLAKGGKVTRLANRMNSVFVSGLTN